MPSNKTWCDGVTRALFDEFFPEHYEEGCTWEKVRTLRHPFRGQYVQCKICKGIDYTIDPTTITKDGRIEKRFIIEEIPDVA